MSVNASDWSQMDALAEAAYDTFGRIDILVNNAGMSPAMPSHEMTEAWFDKIVSLNFKGPFRLASNLAHRMSQGEGGTIINVSSSGALVPLPGVVASPIAPSWTTTRRSRTSPTLWRRCASRRSSPGR